MEERVKAKEDKQKAKDQKKKSSTEVATAQKSKS